MRIVVRSSILLACVALGGCAHNLLPDSSTDSRAAFADFEAAQHSFERIVPYQTTAADLKAMGFDTAMSNVRQIPYPDVVGRLAPNGGIALADLDVGIRDCILARLRCRAYEFRIGHETRTRTGGFIRDFLNFERTTSVVSWHFEALVVVREDLVLFRTFGGEPRNERVDHEMNPLGPLQSIGESAAGRMVR